MTTEIARIWGKYGTVLYWKQAYSKDQGTLTEGESCWEDITVWLDGARPSPNKPKYVFDKLVTNQLRLYEYDDGCKNQNFEENIEQSCTESKLTA